MTISEIIQLLAFFLQTSLLIIIYMQIRADHIRRMRQATIDVINKDYSEARQQLESRYGHEFLSDVDVSLISEDKEKYALITRLMGVLEYICTGINTGIYDGDLVYRLTGTSFIRNYSRLEKVIAFRRQRESPTICVELQIVVAHFQDKKAKETSRDSNFAVIKNIFVRPSK